MRIQKKRCHFFRKEVSPNWQEVSQRFARGSPEVPLTMEPPVGNLKRGVTKRSKDISIFELPVGNRFLS